MGPREPRFGLRAARWSWTRPLLVEGRGQRAPTLARRGPLDSRFAKACRSAQGRGRRTKAVSSRIFTISSILAQALPALKPPSLRSWTRRGAFCPGLPQGRRRERDQRCSAEAARQAAHGSSRASIGATRAPAPDTISAPTPPTVRQPDAGQGTPLRGRLRAPSARAGRAVRCLAVSSTGVSFSRYGASSRSPRSSPITRANCRRSISSRCPNAPPTSPSLLMTARLSPIAATPAAPRSGSSTCRPICRRRLWPSRTGVSTSISASTRSASAAPSCAT